MAVPDSGLNFIECGRSSSYCEYGYVWKEGKIILGFGWGHLCPCQRSDLTFLECRVSTGTDQSLVTKPDKQPIGARNLVTGNRPIKDHLFLV